MFSTPSKMLSKISFVLAPLLLSTVSQAVVWDKYNDPKMFNTNWHNANYQYNFKHLPLEGSLPPSHAPWADSYWMKQRGAMTYRWQQFSNPDMDQQLTQADRQRLFFDYKLYSKKELQNMTTAQINLLSPLEKYSIYLGDYNYPLVKEFKRKNSADRAYWEGYCHAWAPASLHYSEPAPVERINKDGIKIVFGSGDIKALLTAHYADKFVFNLFKPRIQNPQIGTNCKSKFQYPSTKIRKGIEVMTDYSETDGLADTDLESFVSEYQTNARRVYTNTHSSSWIQQNMPEILDPTLPAQARKAADQLSCTDTNAGAFHVVMSNQLGLMKEGFNFDKTRDAEVWNQPAYKFESKLLGEESPSRNSAPGTVVVKVMESILSYADDTDYGWSFFFPTLTSLFRGPDANFMAEYARYNQLLVNEGDETEAPQYPEGIIGTSSYSYKLDVDASGKIIGGDWVSLDRPDFLWIMKKQEFDGNFSRLGEVYEPVKY